ncbi:MAG: polysaccharide deacetylase family protein [Nitrosopumilaceae archaeon]
MLSSKFFSFFAFVATFSLLVPIGMSYAEELTTLELEVKYTNGDRRDAFQTSYVVYQDFSSTPFLEKDFETMPESISLPENHRYKIAIFVDGLYSETGYIDLGNSPEKLDIRIPLPGGIQFNVFFDKGEKPFGNAIIKLKSKNGEELSEGNTNLDGNTLRYWLQPTTLDDDHYSLEVYVEDYLVATVPNIKIFTGTSINEKVTVPIPEVVEELLTFRIFNTDSQKIMKKDGDYSLVLADKNLHPVYTSPMNTNGDIYFSSIKSGIYTVLVLNDGKREKSWDDAPIVIIGDENIFELFENENLASIPPIAIPLQEPIPIPLEEPIPIPLEEPIPIPIKEPLGEPKIYASSTEEFKLSCNCVALRFDDVQDFWLNDVQQEMLEVFSKEKIPLTIGILSSGLQFDENLVNTVKTGIKNGNIEIANHGLDHTPITEFDNKEFEERLKTSQEQIKENFNVVPKVYIPATNIFTDDAKKILAENGFTHFSSSFVYDEPPYSLQNEKFYSFPRVSATGIFDTEEIRFKGIPADTTFLSLSDSLVEHGFAVVTIHPQEHSLFKDEEYQNEPNIHQIQELKKLIKKIKAENIELVLISEIDKKVSKISTSPTKDSSSPYVIPNWIKNNAGWWRDGHIDNDAFVQGIQFLINEGIIQIPPTSQGSGGSEIPNWVKNNAGWWAEGQISDDDFVQGINHLINLGVIIIGN